MADGTKPRDYAIEGASSYVKMRYTVRVVDGPVLKGAVEPEIMDFVTGYMQVIPGLEKRLIGHCTGESLAFSVPPEEAFGLRHDDLVIEKNKAEFHFPPGMEPFPGMEIPLISGNENAPDTVLIREVKEDTIVIDLNPPLSGAALQYELEILEARPATSTDVCSEWDQQKTDQACCPAVPEIVLGVEESDEE